MQSKIKIIFLALSLIVKYVLSLTMYFKIKINCGNDYPDYINSTEGLIKPNNPSYLWNGDRGYDNYTFDFNVIKHNIETPLCIEWVNLYAIGVLSFDTFLVNEYDFSNVEFENFFSCENCDFNTPKKFYTTNNICAGKIILLIQYQNQEDILFVLILLMI